LKRGALSEWDLKRATGGFEAKKWSWQQKKEEEMKAFLKYKNLCNVGKKSLAAKFAEKPHPRAGGIPLEIEGGR